MDNPFDVVRGPDGAIWYTGVHRPQDSQESRQTAKIHTMAGTGTRATLAMAVPRCGRLQSAAREFALIKTAITTSPTSTNELCVTG